MMSAIARGGRWRVVAAIAVVALAASGGGWAWGRHSTASGSVGDRLPAATVKITRQTLSETVAATGSVGFGASSPVDVKVAGTITWLPPVDSLVGRGAPVARVDDQPVIALIGAIPMYRALAVDAKGADVLQFERNLAELGFGGFTVDDRYSSATVLAVRRWQKALGLPETGVVDVGRILYLGAPVRVAQVAVRVGSTTPATVLHVTGTAKLITSDIATSKAAWARPGVKVALRIAGGQPVPGVVASVGASDVSGESTTPHPAPSSPADPTGPASPTGSTGPASPVSPAAPAAPDGAAPSGSGESVRVVFRLSSGSIEGGAGSVVQVTSTVRERRDVLTVPVTALLALAGGGYGLEVVEGATTRIVPVTTGLFTDASVEVSGPGVDEGLTVGATP